MIEEHIENTPKCKINSYCLGDIDFDYDMYLSSFEEIPQAPRNPNDVLRESLQILNGQIRWNSPLSFYNICPPTMMNTVAASTITNIYNPNGMIDRTSAGYLKMENKLLGSYPTYLILIRQNQQVFLHQVEKYVLHML